MELKNLSIKELYGVALNELRNGDSTVAIKELKTEFEKRKLPMPLPLVVAPKMIIVQIIEVPKKKSDIIIPQNIDTRKIMDFYHNHPMQARIVAMSEDIDWDDLYIGAKIFINMDRPAVGLYRHQGETYTITTHNSIIGIE